MVASWTQNTKNNNASKESVNQATVAIQMIREISNTPKNSQMRNPRFQKNYSR